MTPYNNPAATSVGAATSNESKQDGLGAAVVPVATTAAAAAVPRAEEQEILEAVDRLSHYHSTRHHFHKPGRQLGARFGRVFVAGAGCVVVCLVLSHA